LARTDPFDGRVRCGTHPFPSPPGSPRAATARGAQSAPTRAPSCGIRARCALPLARASARLPLPFTQDRTPMIFAAILFWFLVVAGGYLALNAYWLAAVALFRPVVERAHETYATRPVAATLAGVLALVPVGMVFAVFARTPHPAVKLLTGAALMVPLIL